eukprot:SAG11_NODE_3753_length_2250_cov_7.771269_1_plen_114_part_10
MLAMMADERSIVTAILSMPAGSGTPTAAAAAAAAAGGGGGEPVGSQFESFSAAGLVAQLSNTAADAAATAVALADVQATCGDGATVAEAERRKDLLDAGVLSPLVDLARGDRPP